MNETLYLIAQVAGTRVAFRSSQIDSVVVVKQVTPVPHAPPHIGGLFALRSRVMTLIDARVVVGRGGGDCVHDQAGGKAIIVNIDGHAYGIVANAVEDACFIADDEVPLRGRLDAGWRGIADAMIEHDGRTLLVVDPARLIHPPHAEAA